jgi:hypothetical protein
VKRRIILHLVVFLILGAVVNVAVAAWFHHRSAFGPYSGDDALPVDELDAIWREHGIGQEYRRTLHGWRTNRVGGTYALVGNAYFTSSTGGMGGVNGGGTSTTIWLAETGLPMRTVALARTDAGVIAHLRDPSWTSRLAGYRLVWPGFAINTLFYGAILWLLFAGVGFVKRRRRVKRGLCPACAYPVGVSPVCTECGRVVVRAAHAAN